MLLRGARALAREVHELEAVAVAAFEGVVRLEPRPLVLRESEALRLELSRVSMVPKTLPHTSFDACILRAILCVHSCGTWQSGHFARTPLRFV